MSVNYATENAAHRAAVLIAEATRQAAGGTKAGEIAFHQAVLASAKVNNAPNAAVSARLALAELGQGWVA